MSRGEWEIEIPVTGNGTDAEVKGLDVDQARIETHLIHSRAM